MPSILNATTTSGLVTSADNSGSLQIQTNNGTTAVTINTSQQIGVGTTSPAAPLDVVSDSNSSAISVRGRSSDNLSAIRIYSNSGATQYGVIRGASDELRVNATEAIPLTFYTNNTERMRIDSSGRVTMPYQPAFMARKLGGNLASGATITFGDVTLNIGNHYNASTYTFTAPIAGKYFFTLNVAVENSGSYTAYIVWNGTDFTGGEVAASSQWQQSTATCILPLAAGDTVRTRIVGTWSNVDSGQWTGFAGYLLG